MSNITITIAEKIAFLGLDKNINLSNEQIDLLYNAEIKNKSKKNNDILKNKKNKGKSNKKYDTTDAKYIVLLKFLNIIMKNLNKEPITKLESFHNIIRSDLIKIENQNALIEMEEELHTYFNKNNTGWYRRNITKSYIITFLRCACENIGYEFTSVTRHYNKDDNTKSMCVLYSIK